MVKRVYLYAWVLLIAAAVTSILSGTFEAPQLLAVSVGVVGLVYAFALWAVMEGSGNSNLNSPLSEEEA